MSGPRAENRDRPEFVTEGRRETRNKDDRDKIGGRINFFFNNSFAPRCASMPLSWPRSVLRPEVAAASQGTERERKNFAGFDQIDRFEGGNHDAGVTKSMLHRLLSPSLSYFFRFNREARFPSRDNLLKKN